MRLLDVRRKGLYVGTEINQKWWRRYTKDNLFARGNGSFWTDGQAFYFLRYFTKEPIMIAFKDIKELKKGRFHSGKWVWGYPILKIVWTKDGRELSSGFFISKNDQEFELFLSELKRQINTDKSKQD